MTPFPSTSLRTLITGLVVGISLIVVPTQASAATIQDQSNPGPRIGYVIAIDTTFFAQTFRAGVTGQLNRLSLMGCNGEDNLLSVNIKVYNAVSSPPNSTPPSLPSASLGEASISGSGLSVIPSKASGCLTSFDIALDTPASVTAGNFYVFVISATTSATFGDSGLALQSSDISTYSNGNRSRSTDSGTSWTAVTTRNLIFTTYVDGGGGQAPPPVMQQFGKPVSITCNQAQPDGLDWSGVASGGWSESWAQWVNQGNGGPVCGRTLVYSTTQSKWTVE